MAQKRIPETSVGAIEVWRQFEGLPALLGGAVILTGTIENPARGAVVMSRKRIQRLRSHDLTCRVFKPSHSGKKYRIDAMGFGIARIEFQRPPELPVGASPIPITIEKHGCKRRMCIGQRVIQSNCLEGIRFGFGHDFGSGTVRRTPVVIGQTGVCRSIAGVEAYGLLVIFPSFLALLVRSSVQIIGL